MGEKTIRRNDLPLGWEQIHLKDVCEIILGQSPPSETYNTIREGLPFFQGKAEFTELYPIVEKWCSKPKKIAEQNDILLSVRAPVGTTNIADKKCCIGRGLAALRFKNHKFLFYYLRSIEKELDKKGTGTTFKAISGDVVRNIDFPLPPLPEQHRIVAKIEELFSELDKGVEALKTARQQLKVYCQAVLKWAFEGKLTDAENQISIVPLGKIIEVVSGNTPKGLVEVSNRGKYQFYKVSDMNLEGNEVEMRTSKLCLTRSEIEKLRIKLYPKGTVIFPKRGGAILTNKKRILLTESSFDLNLMGALPNEKVTGKYLFYWFQKLDLGKIYDGSNVPQINNKNIMPLEFPICSIKQQEQVVQKIETRLSVADKLEETIIQSLQQAEALRQSILKKAFAGKLVPQDPNDEPAAKLLERIKAEKATQRPVKRSTIQRT